MISWVTSFFHNYTAAFRLEGVTGDQELVKIEILQGSLLASILFMLFTASLYKIQTKNDKSA